MCRFLLLSSDEPCEVREVMEQFARMCEQSTCLDGDWQGDGWGVAWWEEAHGLVAAPLLGADLDRGGLWATSARHAPPRDPRARRLVPGAQGRLGVCAALRARAVCLRVQRPHRRGAPAARPENPRRHRGGENLVLGTATAGRRLVAAGRPGVGVRLSGASQPQDSGVQPGPQRRTPSGQPQRQPDRPAVLPASSGAAWRRAPDLLRTPSATGRGGLSPRVPPIAAHGRSSTCRTCSAAGCACSSPGGSPRRDKTSRP